MSEHKATVAWRRTTPAFDYDTYNRDHAWTFPGGQTLKASAAPEFKGNPQCANPEEALVAALSSCHMLTFLAIAARRGIMVERYDDVPVGFLEKNNEGRMCVTRVILRPKAIFNGPAPDAEKLKSLHEQAHHHCFIANSVSTKVDLEIS